MRRFTVMGFTEAELGFIVAAVFAVMAVVTLAERDAATIERIGAVDKTKQLQEELAELRQKIAEQEAELKKLRELTKGVSTKTPQCWEKGQQREAVGEVLVSSSDSYTLGTSTVDINGVRAHFGQFIDLGNRLGCRFVLRATPLPGVDAVAHARAVSALRRYFDVDDRPR